MSQLNSYLIIYISHRSDEHHRRMWEHSIWSAMFLEAS